MDTLESATPPATPVTAETASPEIVAPAPLTDAQRAFLLQFFAQAQERTRGRGEINAKVKQKEAVKLGLDQERAGGGLVAMAAEGLLEVVKKRGGVAYRLTEVGQAAFQALEAQRPRPPALTDPQRAYLLHFLDQASERTLGQGEIINKVRLKAAEEIGLDPNLARGGLETMAADGLVEVTKKRGSVDYRLTESGQAALQALEAHRPAIRQAGGVYHPPENDDVKRERETCLLLELLKGDRHTLTGAEANRLPGRAKALELNLTTANRVRQEMADRGWITILRQARSVSYTLTASGRLELGSRTFYDASPYTLRGRILNDLLEAARDAAKQFEHPEQAPIAPPSSADLERAVMEEFTDLRREKYSLSGTVPIYEVRQRIRSRFGIVVGRHESFDPIIKGLWQAGRLQLVPISEQGKATPEQLQDSIPGVGETLFFLEAAHEPANI